jgi:hypothetical protein
MSSEACVTVSDKAMMTVIQQVPLPRHKQQHKPVLWFAFEMPCIWPITYVQHNFQQAPPACTKHITYHLPLKVQ